MFDEHQDDEDFMLAVEHELVQLARRLLESEDPNLKAKQMKRALHGREFRTLADLVDAIHAASDPIDFRPLSGEPLQMHEIVRHLEGFLRDALYGVARLCAARALAREPFRPVVAQDPILNFQAEKSRVLEGLLNLLEPGDQLWVSLGLGATNRERKKFSKALETATECVMKLDLLPGRSSEFAATALRGAVRAFDRVGARGDDYAEGAALLAEIVREFADLTERRVCADDDIDGARLGAIRRAVNRLDGDGREITDAS